MARIYNLPTRLTVETPVPPFISFIFTIYTGFILLLGFLLGAWVS